MVLEIFSRSGANLFIGVPIGKGTLLTFCGRNEEFQATVRSCVPTSNGYLAGVNFGELPRNYVPEHLLDPARLVHTEER